jgi:hypothetical protein
MRKSARKGLAHPGALHEEAGAKGLVDHVDAQDADHVRPHPNLQRAGGLVAAVRKRRNILLPSVAQDGCIDGRRV